MKNGSNMLRNLIIALILIIAAGFGGYSIGRSTVSDQGASIFALKKTAITKPNPANPAPKIYKYLCTSSTRASEVWELNTNFGQSFTFDGLAHWICNLQALRSTTTTTTDATASSVIINVNKAQ